MILRYFNPMEWMMTELPRRIPRSDRYTDWNLFFSTPVYKWREMGIVDDKGRFLTPLEREHWVANRNISPTSRPQGATVVMMPRPSN